MRQKPKATRLLRIGRNISAHTQYRVARVFVVDGWKIATRRRAELSRIWDVLHRCLGHPEKEKALEELPQSVGDSAHMVAGLANIEAHVFDEVSHGLGQDHF